MGKHSKMEKGALDLVGEKKIFYSAEEIMKFTGEPFFFSSSFNLKAKRKML